MDTLFDGILHLSNEILCISMAALWLSLAHGEDAVDMVQPMLCQSMMIVEQEYLQ